MKLLLAAVLLIMISLGVVVFAQVKDLERRLDNANEILGERALELGSVYFDDSKYEKAIEQFTDAIHLNHSQLTEVYRQRAEAYYWLGEYPLAIEGFTEAIRLEPEAGEVYSQRGVVYFRLGEYQRAIEDYDEAIRFDPEAGNAYLIRGFAYEDLDMREEADRDFAKAKELGAR